MLPTTGGKFRLDYKRASQGVCAWQHKFMGDMKSLKNLGVEK